MSIEVHREPQLTFQVSMAAESSSKPSVASLVHPRGTTHSIVDVMNLQGHSNDAGESKPHKNCT